MSMTLTEEQTMLQDAARGFLADKAPVSQLRALRDSGRPEGFDRDTWRAMAEMGWAGVLTPEAYGGVEMGYVAAGLIAEETGRTLTASPYLSTAVIGASALARFGSDAQRSDWLARTAAGEALAALAVDEGRKHAPGMIAMRAERSGNGFRLNGAKTFVADGDAADVVIVAARTSGAEDEPAGVTLFLVPRSAAGLSVARRAMVDSRASADFVFTDVEVTADAVLGEVDAGRPALDAILDAGRAGLAAEMSGAAQECLHRTMDYIKQRTQFGRPIGSFQALQHRAAELFADIELAKSIVLKALQAMDAEDDAAPLLVAAAKAKLGRTAQRAAQEAIQMHGGVGVTDEFDIGFFLKRVRVADALYGDANFHTDRFARMRLY